MKKTTEKPKAEGDCSPASCSPCPDCEDTGWVGDQEAGSAYRNGRKTLNDEFQPCGCDRHELAKRRIARANAQGDSQSPDK